MFFANNILPNLIINIIIEIEMHIHKYKFSDTIKINERHTYFEK